MGVETSESSSKRQDLGEEMSEGLGWPTDRG